ncbi:hypothetical protein Dimus_024743 [Dionaea muscipula]
MPIWEAFQHALREQFYPEFAEEEVRGRLLRLAQRMGEDGVGTKMCPGREDNLECSGVLSGLYSFRGEYRVESSKQSFQSRDWHGEMAEGNRSRGKQPSGREESSGPT